MLAVLKIKNIAIIESAEIEFSRGFNVLTGETGAGKSIILDSINAVLGFRTSRELIRTGETDAEVTALFSDIDKSTVSCLESLGLPVNDDNSLVISRVISADKNVCRVNFSLTTVSSLKELGSTLINIHGQQDSRELLDSDTHLSYIDSVADDGDLLENFKNRYVLLSDTDLKIKKMSADKAERARKIDMLTYQIDELEKADICPGEWEELKNRRSVLQNFEKIQSAFFSSYDAISGSDGFEGALQLVSGALREIESVSKFSADAEKLSSALSEVYYSLSDISDTLRYGAGEDDFSPNELSQIEDRLDLLYRLSKKYGDTEQEMLSYLKNAKEELENISLSDETLEKLVSQRDNLYEEAYKSALSLSSSRRRSAKIFAEKVCDELRFLDMPYVKFSAEFTDVPLCESGIDSAQFLISANIGEDPKPIAKIASGGELSRIMLAFKNVLSDKDKIATMIFDEIDSGVSGRAAVKIASKLCEVSRGRQVICVTHLAQIASKADSHYLIEKSAHEGKTYTSIKELDREGRKLEISRIIGGGEITETQLKNAEEMLGF